MARPLEPIERLSERLARLPLVRPRAVEPVPVRIDRRRVYILPTGFGLFLGVMLAAMVLGGLNYNNNPALLLAFVTIAVAHNSLVQAHLTLSGLRLVALHAEPVFAGQSLAVRAAFEATGLRRRPGPEAEKHHRDRNALLPAHAQANFLLGMAQTSTGVTRPMMVAMVSGVAQGSCNPV